MAQISENNKLKISLKKFIPFFLLDIIMTSTTGSLGTAVSNNIISELNYAPWIGGIVVSMASAGFLVFTLAFGHISDKYGQRNVILIIIFTRFGCSLFYLVPITSNLHLIIFGLILFIDGGASGLFWPTIQQISVFTEKFGGLRLKQKYMSGYNFSWNFGFIFGMLMGTIIVYLFNSNYSVFYYNTFGLIFGIVVALLFVKNSYEIFKTGKNSATDSQQTVIKGIKDDFIRDEQLNITSRLTRLPLYSLLLVLLIHSSTDGVMTIFLTLKIDLLHQELYWVFLLSLIKLFSQMVATMIFSFTKKKQIARLLMISITVVAISWFIIMMSNDLGLLAVLLTISGFGQGIIYPLIMNLISYKARDKNSAKPFSYFQAVMSGGRMTGSQIYGLSSIISLDLGILIILTYEVFTFIQFNLNWNYSSREQKKNKTKISKVLSS